MTDNLNTGDVTRALETLLKADPGFSSRVKSINRSAPVNVNPDYCPWCSVYKGTSQYVPRTMGLHSNTWQLTVTPRVVLQAFAHEKGSDAEDVLEELVQLVVGLVFRNPTLSGTVDHVVGCSTDYGFIQDDKTTAFLQMASVTITAEVATGAT